MKHTKLNMRGFSHELLAVAVVVIVAIGGAGYAVASHANAASSGGAPIAPNNTSNAHAATVASNPDKCAAPFQETSKLAVDSRGPVYDYFSNTTASGKLIKDHVLTLQRQDAALAKVGYCKSGGIVGYAYRAQAKVSQTGVTTAILYQYTNKDHHHFYAVKNQAVPEGYKRTLSVAKVATQDTAGLIPVFEYYNPGVNGHYLFTSNIDPSAQKYFQSIGYSLHATAPVFYLWSSADGKQPTTTSSKLQPAQDAPKPTSVTSQPSSESADASKN